MNATTTATTNGTTLGKTTTFTRGRDLVLERIIEAPREKLYEAWTDPELMKQWFVPKPWSLSRVESDVRAGGASLIVMRSPEGQEFPNKGVYLEVVPGEKLVFTDAYTKAWEPSAKPFFTGVLTFEDEGGLGSGRTRYTARVLHWTKEDCEAHEKMGFHQGWGIATDQMTALAKTL